jgi:diguanylate cyclase (GGDEF)-like protein/PAS domain S-box-containing protein
VLSKTVDNGTKPVEEARTVIAQPVETVALSQEDIARDLLERFPKARVSAVTVDGTPVEVPETVPLDVHVRPGTAGMKAYVPEDRAALIIAFDQALRTGIGRATARLLQEPDVVLDVHMVDTTTCYGVVLAVAVAGGDHEGAPQRGWREAVVEAPRLARLHKGRTAEILAIDPATTDILGWAPEDMVGKRSLEFIHPDDQGLAIDNWAHLMSDTDQSRRVRIRHRAKNGDYIWFEVGQSWTTWQGEDCVVADMVDISKEMAAQQALEAREQLLRQLTQALPLGVFQVDGDGRIVYTNDRLFELIGPAGADTLVELGPWVADRSGLREAVDCALRTGLGSEVDIRVLGSDGRPARMCQVTVRALTSRDATVTGALGCVADVTEPTMLRLELEDRATFDPLTRCHNRSAIMSVLNSVLESQASTGGGTALLFIDLDDFKSVNDRFGHLAGDEFLAATAARLRGGVRETATVGRQGGDEFLIVCPGVDSVGEAQGIAERIVELLGQDVALSVGTLKAGASVGIAFTADSTVTGDALVARADAAMYESKRGGGGQSTMLP